MRAACGVLLPAETFSTCGGNIRSLRSGACSLLLGGLARGFEVRVDLKLDRVARGVRGLDVQLGRWLEQRMVSSTSKAGPLRLLVHGNSCGHLKSKQT